MWRRMGSSWSSEKLLKPAMRSSESWHACTFKEVSNRSQKATKKTLPVSYHCLTFSVFEAVVVSSRLFTVLRKTYCLERSCTRSEELRLLSSCWSWREVGRTFMFGAPTWSWRGLESQSCPRGLLAPNRRVVLLDFSKISLILLQPWVRPGWYRPDRITTVLIKNWNHTLRVGNDFTLLRSASMFCLQRFWTNPVLIKTLQNL